MKKIIKFGYGKLPIRRTLVCGIVSSSDTKRWDYLINAADRTPYKMTMATVNRPCDVIASGQTSNSTFRLK